MLLRLPGILLVAAIAFGVSADLARAQVLTNGVSRPFVYSLPVGPVVDQSQPYAGPVLTGYSGVVWGEARRNRLRLLRVGLGAAGGQPVFEAVGASGGDVYSHLSAGHGFLALGFASIARPAGNLSDSGTDGGTVVIADGGGPALLRSGCRFACSQELAAADDDMVAYLVSSLDPARDLDTVIRNVRTGAEVRLPIDGTYGHLAGRYLSYNSRSGDKALVVYDWVAQRELYRLPGQGTGVSGDLIGSQELSALQDDGTVVFRDPRGRPAWASPAQPVAHRLAVADAGYRTFALEGGLAVLGRIRGFDVDRSVGELVAVPLGGSPTLLATNLTGGPAVDFDGRRVAFFDRTCEGLRVVARPTTELGRRPWTKRRTCRLTLRSKVRRQRNRLVALFSCGRLGGAACALGPITARSARSYRVAGKLLRRGRLLARARTARNGKLSVQLTSAGKRLVGRRAVRVKLDAYASSSALADSQRQTTTVTLSRRR